MNFERSRIQKINEIRSKLSTGSVSVGSWMQIPSEEIAEMMGDAGYDWVAVDMEHGSISTQQLPSLFRAIQFHKNALPMARLANGDSKECKQALEAGAGGVIVPMIETEEQIKSVISSIQWPPNGTRGVGYSRANLYGKNFESYKLEAKQPILIAMIEHINGVNNLKKILNAGKIDAILIGPYDLSASLGEVGQFNSSKFINAINRIHKVCKDLGTPYGVHIVQPNKIQLKNEINNGAQFIAYGIDAVFFNNAIELKE